MSQATALLISILSFIFLLLFLAVMSSKDSPFFFALMRDPTAFFTMILAVFTMGLAVITFLVWMDTKSVIREQRESILQQNANALASIEIARSNLALFTNSFEKQIETTKKELRAYLGIEVLSIDFICFVGSKAIFSCLLKIINTGKTPARNVRNDVKFCLQKWSEMDEEHISWPETPGFLSTLSFIGASKEPVVTAAHGLEIGSDAYTDANLRLCLACILTYNDQFNNRQTYRLFGSIINTSEFIRKCKHHEEKDEKFNIQFELAKFGNSAT